MPDLIRYPFSGAGVWQAVEALGTTPDAIAANLLAMGFKGCISSSINCPIARYLTAVVEDAHIVDVTQTESADIYVRVSRRCGSIDFEVADAIGFPAASRFVELFDDGHYPELKG